MGGHSPTRGSAPPPSMHGNGRKFSDEKASSGTRTPNSLWSEALSPHSASNSAYQPQMPMTMSANSRVEQKVGNGRSPFVASTSDSHVFLFPHSSCRGKSPS